MKQRLLFLLFLIAPICFAQNVKVLKGKIIADMEELRDINIKNLSSRVEVATLNDGSFSITAKVGDTLIFSAIQLKTKKIIVEKEDFDYFPFVVKMEVQVTELKEVIVKENKLTAESLGIVPRGMKTYTPAERRYYTATTGSGFVSVDGIINMINGKTKQIKKEIVVEKNQLVQSKLGNMYDEEFIIREFNIPKEHVEGFVVFAAENKRVATAVKDKNKTLTTFILGELSTEYRKRIGHEK